jgi:predicted  nucleic acid-binding Zn-ribbon protein
MEALNQLFDKIEQLKFLIPQKLWDEYISLKSQIQEEIEALDNDIVYLENRTRNLELENSDLFDEQNYLITEIENLKSELEEAKQN